MSTSSSLFNGEVLLMLRQLDKLLSGEGWTREALARNFRGEPLHPLDPRARQWCLLGGCTRVAWKDPEPARREERLQALTGALVAVEPAMFFRTLPVYNDQEGKDVIMKVIYRAIEVQEAALERL